jgi:hypothetical protein
MPLVFAAPFAPPVVAGPTFSGIRSTWTGWDGSEWDLRDWRRGVTLLFDGVKGLHNPRIDKFRSESSSVPGHRLRGWRTAGRDVFWPVQVYGDGSDQWLAVYDAFFDSIHPDREGVWTVETATSKRTLRLTGVFDDEHSFARDPYLAGWATFPIDLEAAQPYWEGAPVIAGPFTSAEPVDFIPEGGAPPFHISEASTFASASIRNPGDVEAWLRAVIDGPLTAVTLGADGWSVSVPFDVPEGQRLLIDSDPRNVTATLDGVNVTAELGLVDFAPVEPRQRTSLEIGAVGAGSVKVELTPLYFKAF